MGSFVLDYLALYLQHFMYTVCYIELFRHGSVQEFYHLKVFITLEQYITSLVEKKNNLNEQNFEFYWKTRMENKGWRIKYRLKKL